MSVNLSLGNYFLQNDVQLWCFHFLIEGASDTSPKFQMTLLHGVLHPDQHTSKKCKGCKDNSKSHSNLTYKKWRDARLRSSEIFIDQSYQICKDIRKILHDVWKFHKRCSMLPPLLAMYALHRRTMDWRTLWKILAFCWIYAAAQTILATKFNSELTGVACTTLFSAFLHFSYT